MDKQFQHGVWVKLPERASTPEEIEVKRVFAAREQFAKDYALSKGWSTDLSKLDIPKLLEIRAQKEWKNP